MFMISVLQCRQKKGSQVASLQGVYCHHRRLDNKKQFQRTEENNQNVAVHSQR